MSVGSLYDKTATDNINMTPQVVRKVKDKKYFFRTVMQISGLVHVMGNGD